VVASNGTFTWNTTIESIESRFVFTVPGAVEPREFQGNWWGATDFEELQYCVSLKGFTSHHQVDASSAS